MSPSNSRSPNGTDTTTIKINDETTPLLAAIATAPIAEASEADELPNAVRAEADDEDAPLPLAQILLLCYTRVVEPIAFFSIFPCPRLPN